MREALIKIALAIHRKVEFFLAKRERLGSSSSINLSRPERTRCRSLGKAEQACVTLCKALIACLGTVLLALYSIQWTE